MKSKKTKIVISIVAVVVLICIVLFANSLFGKQNIDEETATPLTETEIKELFSDAHQLYAEWLSPKAKYLNVDWDNTTEIEGQEYLEVASTEITSVDELKNEFAKYFSEEIIKENVEKYYVMHNGKMYGNAVLVEGGEIQGTKYELAVQSNTQTECNITITKYIEEDKESLNYKIKVIDGKWKFVEAFNWLTMENLVLE